MVVGWRVAKKRRTLVYIPRLGPATRVKRRLDNGKPGLTTAEFKPEKIYWTRIGIYEEGEEGGRRGGEGRSGRKEGEKKCNSQKTLSANQVSVINKVVN